MEYNRNLEKITTLNMYQIIFEGMKKNSRIILQNERRIKPNYQDLTIPNRNFVATSSMAFYFNSLVGIQECPQTSRIEQFPQSIFCRKSFYIPHDS
jgi:hypothetical protein